MGFVRRRAFTVGTRVRVSGGYSVTPEWLSREGGANAAVDGEIVEFVAGPAQQAALVHLDAPLAVNLPGGSSAVGSHLVLSPRHASRPLKSGSIVAVALIPEGVSDVSFLDYGLYVESSAVVRALPTPGPDRGGPVGATGAMAVQTYKTTSQTIVAVVGGLALSGVSLVSIARVIASEEPVATVPAVAFFVLVWALALVYFGRVYRAGVVATPAGIVVRNVTHTRRLAWEEVEGFRLAAEPWYPAICRIDLRDGGRVLAYGVQGRAVSGAGKRAAGGQVDALNARLVEHRARPTDEGRSSR